MWEKLTEQKRSQTTHSKQTCCQPSCEVNITLTWILVDHYFIDASSVKGNTKINQLYKHTLVKLTEISFHLWRAKIFPIINNIKVNSFGEIKCFFIILRVFFYAHFRLTLTIIPVFKISTQNMMSQWLPWWWIMVIIAFLA